MQKNHLYVFFFSNSGKKKKKKSFLSPFERTRFKNSNKHFLPRELSLSSFGKTHGGKNLNVFKYFLDLLQPDPPQVEMKEKCEVTGNSTSSGG